MLSKHTNSTCTQLNDFIGDIHSIFHWCCLASQIYWCLHLWAKCYFQIDTKIIHIDLEVGEVYCINFSRTIYRGLGKGQILRGLYKLEDIYNDFLILTFLVFHTNFLFFCFCAFVTFLYNIISDYLFSSLYIDYSLCSDYICASTLCFSVQNVMPVKLH